VSLTQSPANPAASTSIASAAIASGPSAPATPMDTEPVMPPPMHGVLRRPRTRDSDHRRSALTVVEGYPE